MTLDSERTLDDLWPLLEDVRFAMLCTRDAEGGLRSRPMTMLRRRDAEPRDVWFFTSRSTPAAEDIERDGTVNLAYASPSKDIYVSVGGQASLLDDRALMRELWTPAAKAWFPGGPEDPDLRVVRVRVEHADFWEVKESKPAQVIKMAKAALSGERPENLGRHGSVDVRQVL